MMFGVPSKGAKIDLDMSKIYSKEITLVTSYAASDNDTKEALRLIETSEIDVKQLVTHTYPSWILKKHLIMQELVRMQ